MGIRDDQGGDKNQDITEELDSYYQTNKRTGGGAILYGLFALVVTLIIAAGLFFGGRAVYRALIGSGGEETTEQQGEQDTNGGTQTPLPPEDQDQTPGVDSDSNGTPDSGDGDQPAEGMPSTGDDLPATGSPSGM